MSLSHAPALFFEFVDSMGLFQVFFLPHAFGNTCRPLFGRGNIWHQTLLLEIRECLLVLVLVEGCLDRAWLDALINFSTLNRDVIVIIFRFIGLLFFFLENFLGLLFGLALSFQFL